MIMIIKMTNIEMSKEIMIIDIMASKFRGKIKGLPILLILLRRSFYDVVYFIFIFKFITYCIHNKIGQGINRN